MPGRVPGFFDMRSGKERHPSDMLRFVAHQRPGMPLAFSGWTYGAAIGSSWIDHPVDLNRIGLYAGDEAFQQKLAAVKRVKKQVPANFIKEQYNIEVDTGSIFDVHVKRFHLYRRQLLNALRIMERNCSAT
jgi:glucan phosphorylase